MKKFDNLCVVKDIPTLAEAIEEFNRTGQFILSHTVNDGDYKGDAKTLQEVQSLNLEGYGSGDFDLFDIASRDRQNKFNLHPNLPEPSNEPSNEPSGIPSNEPSNNIPSN